MTENNEIIIGNNKYQIEVDEDGNASVKKFNDKYKIWLVVNFSSSVNQEAEDKLKEMLKDIYKKNCRI